MQKAAHATNLFTAFATEAVDFALMDRVTIVSPFLPTDIQLFHQKSLLCQLQSRFRGEVSIVTPAVGHDFFFWAEPGRVAPVLPLGHTVHLECVR
jgi:hypothetical protein